MSDPATNAGRHPKKELNPVCRGQAAVILSDSPSTIQVDVRLQSDGLQMRNVETDTMMHPADPRKISRRGFLHATVLGAGALTVAGKTSLSLHAGEGPARKPIRLGIIGVGPRGLWLL
ncbi:MAG TPA: hypothetical protein PLH97_08280, partial [Verrucomicrobiota bacterium]|nr:hypothetical protein [Verrucomicrobiota bacterium]